MSFVNKLFIPFDAMFPDERVLEIHEYFQGISRNDLLKTGAFFLGFNNNNSQFSHPINFLDMFFSKENSHFRFLIEQNLEIYIATEDYEMEDYSFPNPISSLTFFQKVFDLGNDDETSLTNSEIEQNIFKAYLILNQSNIDRGPIVTKSTEHCTIKNKISCFLIATHLYSYDLTNYNISKLLSTQVVKGVLFFNFLEAQKECSLLLKSFLDYFDVDNYRHYYKKILPLTFAIVKRDNEAHTDIILDDDEFLQENVSFLDKLAADDLDILEDVDFRKVRAKPIYKITDSSFRIVCPQFVIELLFNGLFWKFKDLNDSLPNNVKIKNFYDFKTYYFSEKYILYRILREYFGNRFLQRNGDDLDTLCDGAPDYYVRNGKRIFLFESKDILLNVKIKQSSDFIEIEKEIKKKLYKKVDNTPKAIMQLINTIRKALTLNLEYDKNYKPNRIIIYPVLILHNRMFNVTGLNKLLNFWLQNELEILEKEGLNISNVKPLVLIDIDTLIFHKDVFVNRKLSLEEVLIEYQNDYLNFSVEGKKYNSQEEANQATKDSYVSFAHYLDVKIDKMGLWSLPNEFQKLAYGIVA